MTSSFQHAEHHVTASDLVRQFGVWQARAAQAPVYILHRGRPRLVLTSVDLMKALCAPHLEASGEARRLQALLGATDEIVLMVDRQRRVTTSSRLARGALGEIDGIPVERIADRSAPLLAAAIDRVVASGMAEAAEIGAAGYPGRRWRCAIEPMTGGAVLVIRDITEDLALAERIAELDAHEAATRINGAAATVRLGLRGYIERATPSLVALTGIAADALKTARFVTLFDVASRVALGEALERVLDLGEERRIVARLLVNRAEPRPVAVGLAPVTRGAAPTAAIAHIVAADVDNGA